MKILASTDGSELSYKALREAALIAGKTKAEVTVIYVEDPVPHPSEKGLYFSEDSLKQYESRREEDREKITADVREIFEAESVEIKMLIEKGHAADTIIQLADEGQFDLLVMGSRGWGGVNRLLLGSVSHAVVQNVKTSVLIVR